MARFAYQSNDTGAGNGRFLKILLDRKNGRALNVTTNTWKAAGSVSSSDRRLFLQQGASPFLGLYSRELALGPVGEFYEYTADLTFNDGRPFYCERRYVSDGAFAQTPDAATNALAGKAHFEFIHLQTGLGPNRLFVRAMDHATGEIWNRQANAWAPFGSVSESDSRIFLWPESGDFANVYAIDVDGMGSRQELWLHYYDAQLFPNEPKNGVERFRLFNGSVTSGGSLPPFKIEAVKAHGVLTVADRLDPNNEPDTILVVNARAAPTFLARLVDASGAPILAAAIASIRGNVSELRAWEPSYERPIAGHYQFAIPVSESIFDVLQVNYLWDDQPDSQGYNFRFQPSTALYQAFPDRGKLYALEIEFTPTTGECFGFRFLVKTK
jgi:hypothetical protein